MGGVLYICPIPGRNRNRFQAQRSGYRRGTTSARMTRMLIPLALLAGCHRPTETRVRPVADAQSPTPVAAPAAPPPAPPPPRGKVVTVLYSSNLRGEYEAHPLGGLARRKTAT